MTSKTLALLRVTVLLVATLLIVPRGGEAQWTRGGVSLSDSLSGAANARVCLDGAGSAYVAWTESRDYPETGEDIYIQRVTGSGHIAPGWPVIGLAVCRDPDSQFGYGMVPDGLGGVLVSWQDHRGDGANVYVQRVIADGSIAAGWPVDGAPAGLFNVYQIASGVAPDGMGGAYVAWEDQRSYPQNKIYAQHLMADGSIALGWPADGLPVCTERSGAAGDGIAIIPDDAGGVVMVWADFRVTTDPFSSEIYAQRLTPSGAIAPGWAPNGNRVSLGWFRHHIAADEAGGFYVVSASPGPNASFLPLDRIIRVQRMTFAGQPAPGWPAEGVVLCDAPDERALTDASSDGAGGMLATWYDYRPPRTGGEIYVTRVRPDGTGPVGWPEDGLRVSDPLQNGNDYDPYVASNGMGGAYVTWTWDGSMGRPAMVQHLTAGGQVSPGWPPSAVIAGTAWAQEDPDVVADGFGGAIVVWRANEPPGGLHGMFAQHFGTNGPTPVAVALASAEAEPGRVILTWQATGAAALTAQVQRRGAQEDWRVIGDPIAVDRDRLRYEDTSVVPGGRYAYRLAYRDEAGEQLTAETWVDVPSSLQLALRGFTPNPARGAPTIALTLPSAVAATLEVLDVAGRRVVSREVGSLGAGRHLARLEQRLKPGMYVVRLATPDHVLTARGVVLD